MSKTSRVATSSGLTIAAVVRDVSRIEVVIGIPRNARDVPSAADAAERRLSATCGNLPDESGRDAIPPRLGADRRRGAIDAADRARCAGVPSGAAHLLGANGRVGFFDTSGAKRRRTWRLRTTRSSLRLQDAQGW
jgi:hypothetical protein